MPCCQMVILHKKGERGARRDNGNDFSFPVPSPFLKLNDNSVKSFLSGYPNFEVGFKVKKMKLTFKEFKLLYMSRC